jgi:hypothetical protein
MLLCNMILFILSFGLGPAAWIVPLIVCFIVVVVLLYGVGGVKFAFSGERPTLESEMELSRQRGIFRPDLFGEEKTAILLNCHNPVLQKKFNARIADIAAGKGNTSQAVGELKNLGVSVPFALQNPDRALEMVLAGLGKMKNPVGQSSAATSIFGSVLSAKLMEVWNKTRKPQRTFSTTTAKPLADRKPFIELPNGKLIPLEESEVRGAFKDKYKVVYR